MSHRPSDNMQPPLSPTLSATSTASTTATVIDSHPNPKSLINLGKQLKFLSIGLVLSLYFQVYQHLADALSLGIASSLSARLALLAVGLLAGTVIIFTHVILLPARGYSINYVDWRHDVHLSKAIPALTACIIFGWILLLVTLSPVGAPAPPASSIKQRLAQAAAYTGLDSLQARINSLPPSFFPAASTATTATRGKLATAAGSVEKSWDNIAAYLSLAAPHKSTLHSYFLKASERADDWTANNIRIVGWTGAILGSIGTYLAVFGAVGLIGFLAPDRRPNKSKSF